MPESAMILAKGSNPSWNNFRVSTRPSTARSGILVLAPSKNLRNLRTRSRHSTPMFPHLRRNHSKRRRMRPTSVNIPKTTRPIPLLRSSQNRNDYGQKVVAVRRKAIMISWQTRVQGVGIAIYLVAQRLRPAAIAQTSMTRYRPRHHHGAAGF